MHDILLIFPVSAQSVVLSGNRLVREGGFATVAAQIHMLHGDLLAVENNDQVLVTSGGPYADDSRPDNKYEDKRSYFPPTMKRILIEGDGIRFFYVILNIILL